MARVVRVEIDVPYKPGKRLVCEVERNGRVFRYGPNGGRRMVKNNFIITAALNEVRLRIQQRTPFWLRVARVVRPKLVAIDAAVTRLLKPRRRMT